MNKTLSLDVLQAVAEAEGKSLIDVLNALNGDVRVVKSKPAVEVVQALPAPVILPLPVPAAVEVKPAKPTDRGDAGELLNWRYSSAAALAKMPAGTEINTRAILEDYMGLPDPEAHTQGLLNSASRQFSRLGWKQTVGDTGVPRGVSFMTATGKKRFYSRWHKPSA